MTEAECVYQSCVPATHPTCSKCNLELRTRRDCLSGKEFRCSQCSGVVCKKCCDADPRMDWETFHKKWMKKYKPACHSCEDRCFPGEGFVEKVAGQMVCFCSHSCLEEWEESDDEHKTDEDWGCWKIHVPSTMIDALLE